MNGILFTPDNIKSIRDKLKTQTRRLDHLKEINKSPNLWKWIGYDQAGRFSFRFEPSGDVYNYFPRYRVGETVYIKEAWWEDSGDIYFKSDLPEGQIPTNMHFTEPIGKSKWHSPLFLKEIHARDFIKITDVRPERLQDITEEDAKAEGMPYIQIVPNPQALYPDINGYRRGFVFTWNEINGKTYPFDGNYWVWRICFNLMEDKR